jgi:4-hydroxythreonine-4-phosphate dehydrogenase
MAVGKPIIAVTMGDPAGIGPEIAAMCLGRSDVQEICQPVVVGDAEVMRRAVGLTQQGHIAVHPISTVSEARFTHENLNIVDLHNVDLSEIAFGQLSAAAGHAAFEAVSKAIELALDQQVHATVTGPIHKEAIHLAGHRFAGHTEIFARLTSTADYAMMLVHGKMRVVHVTTHVPIREACDLIKKDRVLTVIRLAHRACVELGSDAPRIGVAGLNPHASDGGLFGHEETDEIIPAIQVAQADGIQVEGPMPPDTMFPMAAGGLFDAAVAMYHDQGHIPFKMVGFHWSEQEQRWDSVRGVNITLGLPIIRTSVDHGTAFDIAGKGTADPGSLANAIEHATRLAGRRTREPGQAEEGSQ